MREAETMETTDGVIDWLMEGDPVTPPSMCSKGSRRRPRRESSPWMCSVFDMEKIGVESRWNTLRAMRGLQERRKALAES